LVAVTEQNKPFFFDFLVFLKSCGYESLHSFINEKDSDTGIKVLIKYFRRTLRGLSR
jgi:hypothetical protein